MEIFRSAFKRERSNNYKRGGRQLNEINNILQNELPEFLIHYSRAQKYYELGKLNDSLFSINKTIQFSDIDDWKQYAFKANVLEELNLYQDAIRTYEIAIDINQSDINVYALYHQIGWCFMNIKNDERAVEFYSYALELKKLHPNSYLNEDLEGIDNGVLLGKKFTQMYVNRGNSYKNIGKLTEAQNDCIKALEIEPNYSNPYLLLYQIYSLSNQKEKSLEFLNKSAQLGNKNAIHILNDLNKEVDYKSELEKCLRLTFEQHDLIQGKNIALGLINKGINDIIPYICLSAIFATERNWQQCEDFSRKGLNYERNNKMLLNHLGVAICEQGNHRINEGLEYFKKGALLGDQNCTQNYNYWSARK